MKRCANLKLAKDEIKRYNVCLQGGGEVEIFADNVKVKDDFVLFLVSNSVVAGFEKDIITCFY